MFNTSLLQIFSLTSASGWIATLVSIPGIILFVSFRGFFQSWVAKKLGDDTPANNGFLTMNPMAHIDLIGFICMILVGFGFGKAIPFNSRNYKNMKRDGALQILSAPAAGLILALIFRFLLEALYLIGTLGGFADNKIYAVFLLILFSGANTAVSLTVFLFLPLPGFDSYRLVANFLPFKCYRALYNIEKYSLFIFLGFILLLNIPVIGDNIQYYLLTVPTNFLYTVISAPWSFLSDMIFAML